MGNRVSLGRSILTITDQRSRAIRVVRGMEHKGYQRMKIWFISDTHCEHENLEVPEVDAVIHCGDESNHGNPWMNEAEARSFFEWYSALQIPLKIFVPGNHSTAIEQGLVRGSDFPAVKFLIHESTEWNELKKFRITLHAEFFRLGLQ